MAGDAPRHVWLRRFEPAVFYSALIYAALLLFSVNYLTIYPGLDPSWAYALNRFAHGPLLFGKDLVFTYGPLAYLAVPQHVGANIPVAGVVHILVWAVLIYQLVLLHDSGRRFGALAFTLALICSNRLYLDYWDYLLSALILLSFLLLFQKPDSRSILVVMSLAIGAIFLIKFTGYIMAMLLLAVWATGRLLARPRAGGRELSLLALAFVSGPLAYLLYNPSVTGLYGYVRGSLSISSGFSSAMSLPTPPAAAWHAGMLCLVLAASTGISLWRGWISAVGGSMVILVMWVAFKHGFVLSEPNHQAMFYCFVLQAFAFLLAQMNYTIPKAALFAVIFFGFTFSALQGAATRWPVWTRYWWSPDVNLAKSAELLNSKALNATLDAESANAFRTALIHPYLQTLSGSRVLMFPWDVAYGSLGKFTLVPLFATQAYAAYTQYLDQESASRIANASPPIDYVLFEWKAIFDRHPLLDTPDVWNALYSMYVPAITQPDATLLKRRATSLQTAFRGFSKGNCPAEEWIGVPERSTPVALSLDLRPTLVGSVMSTVYQIAPIMFEVKTRAGKTVGFRIPPSVVASPFPLNYLPLDPAALSQLWTSDQVSDPVVAFRIVGQGLSYIHCRGLEFYNLTGTAIHLP